MFAISGGLAGLAGISEVAGQIGQLQPSISPGYGFTAITVAFLGRLNPFGILVASLVVALTFIGGESAQILLKLPLDLTQAFQGLLLLCVLAADALVSYRVRIVGRGVPRMTAFEAILLTIVTASTPLLIAAIGELVAERAGRAQPRARGHDGDGGGVQLRRRRDLRLHRRRGRAPASSPAPAWRRSSRFAVLGLAANQVGSGLALTILGLGLSGLIGAPFVGARPRPDPPCRHSRCSPIFPVVGRLFFGQDFFVYASILLTAAVALFLARTRAGPDAAVGRRKPRLGPCASVCRSCARAFSPSCSAAPARASRAPTCRWSTPASGRPA